MSEAAPTPPEDLPQETDVEIHKPKPVHSWREFLIELGTIVLGICIALAGEQAIEWLRWRGQVAQARQVIATEMANNMVGAVYRLRTQGCIERRLDVLSDILDGASRSGQLPPVGEIGQPPPRTWRNGAWQSLVAADTATHFPPQQLAEMASLYQLVARMEDMTLIDLQAWNDIYPMIGPGRRLDPASEAELRKALSLARATSRAYASQAITLIGRTRALGLPFSASDLQLIANAQRLSMAVPFGPALPNPIAATCGPLGPVPPRYGQADLAVVPALAGEALKSLPDFRTPAP